LSISASTAAATATRASARSSKINGRHGGRVAAAAALALLLASSGAAAGTSLQGAVARGAYLAAAAGCAECHTDSKNGGRPYAGGRALATTYGTLVTPNITPDPRTGIGRWSTVDFFRALRWGVAPDDTHYLPVFPFPFYSRLTAADLRDLWAFLDSLPAVPQANRPSRLAAFAPLRGATAVLATPFPGPFRADPAESAPWNRGAYLVATVGRCGDCHTPRTRLGGPEAGRALAGAPASGGKWIPNITPDPATGIGRWSTADIETLLADGQTPDFDFVGGPMAVIVRNTARLDDADRHAIAVYLRSIHPVRSQQRPRK
jgi:mono/diheme cytochrome c family protein